MAPTIEGTRAQAKFVRMSAKKVRPVLDLVRGEPVLTADEILQFTPRDAAKEVRKVLASAIANAEHNDGMDPDTLFVAACYADEGPTIRRFRPRARGRATRINKRTSHITVIVDRLDDEELEALQERASRRAGDASEARRRRVAASRGEDAEETTDVEEIDDVVDTDEAAETVEADDVVDTDGVVDTDEVVEAAEAPKYEGSHPVTEDGEMPEGFPIKGNEDSMKFHTPESPWYDRTIAEVWFADEAAAEAAGFVNAVQPKDDADAEQNEEDA